MIKYNALFCFQCPDISLWSFGVSQPCICSIWSIQYFSCFPITSVCLQYICSSHVFLHCFSWRLTCREKVKEMAGRAFDTWVFNNVCAVCCKVILPFLLQGDVHWMKHQSFCYCYVILYWKLLKDQTGLFSVQEREKREQLLEGTHCPVHSGIGNGKEWQKGWKGEVPGRMGTLTVTLSHHISQKDPEIKCPPLHWNKVIGS